MFLNLISIIQLCTIFMFLHIGSSKPQNGSSETIEFESLDSTTPALQEIPETLKLVILHTNDMHGRFSETSAMSGQCNSTAGERCYGGFGRIATKAREIKKQAKMSGEEVLFLNAGDTYTGSVLFSYFRADITSKFVNLLEFDALSLGNHEFDYGVNELVPFLQDVKAPILCANIDTSKEEKFNNYRHLIKPSVILDVKGHKIGIIGYLTNETVYLAQTENVHFIYEVDAINVEATKLHLQGIKTIIAVGHSGFDVDKDIAMRCPLVDIVVGGHTNTFLYTGKAPDMEQPEGKYPYTVKQASGKQVPVVQAYAYTKYLGELHVELNLKGDVLKSWGNPVLLTGDIEPAPDALELLNKFYSDKRMTRLNSRIAYSRVTLDNRFCRQRECNIGNMITDSMVYTFIKSNMTKTAFWTDAPIALLNSGGIRTSFNGKKVNGVFPISNNDLEEVLPFRNTLKSTTITGAELLDVLNLVVQRYDRVHGGFLQMSGVHVVYDLTDKNNYKVESVRVRCGHCLVPSYEPLNLTKTYQIVIYSFLSAGGDDFAIFKTKETIDVPGTEDVVYDVEQVAEFMERENPITYGIEDRIIIKKSDIIRRTETDSESAGSRLSGAIPQIVFVNLILCFVNFIFK